MFTRLNKGITLYVGAIATTALILPAAANAMPRPPC